MAHLHRLNIPKTWPLPRKTGGRWVTKPNPGPHSLELAMPLNIVLRDVLKLAENTKEVKRILGNGEILVNKKIRKDKKFPVGLFDVLEIPKLKKRYRLLFNEKGKFEFYEIDEKDSKIKPYKIIGKTLVKGGKLQLNLYDGTNLLVEKDVYKVGDTIVLELGTNKILNHIKFEKGCLLYIYKGKQKSKIGVFEEIREFRYMQPSNIILKTGKGDKIETRKDYVFVIGKEKPVIQIPIEK